MNRLHSRKAGVRIHASRLLWVACLCSASVSVGLELSFEDTFEPIAGMSGTPGSLEGQNGWSIGSGSALVQNGVAFEGSQALELDQGSIGREVVSVPNGMWISFWSYLSAVDVEEPVVNANDGGVVFYINADRHVVAYSNAVPVELAMQVPLGQWIQFVVYCDYADQSWSLSVGGEHAVSGLPLAQGAVSSVLNIEHTAASPMYVDNFLMTDREPAGLVADSDDDMIPDWWEQKYFGHPTDADGSSDGDADGNTLAQEYLAGLNPAVADQFVIAPQSSPGAFSWLTVPERLYDVYWTASLSNSFELIAAGLPWTSNSFMHAEALDYEAGFYQLEVRPGW